MMNNSISPRLLPLEGSYNLRDMGGYPAADGRTVRHGMLYRSGIMSMLTEADEAHLGTLGIATVCDLRQGSERRKEPTRWCEPAGVLYWSRDYEETSGVMSELMRDHVVNGARMREIMIDLYCEIPIDHGPSYRFLFERLLGGHLPLLFNCSAGKDRTGVAAALILGALGVERDVIYEDYLLTNVLADHNVLIDRFGDQIRQFREAGDVVAPLMAADVDYLNAMFDTLDRDHGGFDGYLAAIGVDAAAKARLRDLLLI